MKVLTLILALALVVAACGGDDDVSEPLEFDPVDADVCLVRIHGRTDDGRVPSLIGDVAELWPQGNELFGPGRVWIYFPDEKYTESRDIVAEAIAETGCTRTLVNGFSNGGAMAAALYCAGEDFGGTLEQVVIDDPVTDTATNGCAPAPGVGVSLYWTGVLDGDSQPGTDCDDNGYTCQDGVIIGVDAMAENLGVDWQQSPFDDHIWFLDAPEIEAFLASAS